MPRGRAGGRKKPQAAVCALDAVLRERITSVLEHGGFRVGVCLETVGQLAGLRDASVPDLVVLDSQLASLGAGGEITALRAAAPDSPVVIVATGDSTDAGRWVALAEVQSVVLDAELEERLLPTAAAVLAGQVCVPVSLRHALAQPVFTHRQKQVLELALAGLRTREIASQLFLSESTVKSHLSVCFRKLGVSSREEARRKLESGPEDEGGALRRRT